MRKEVMIRYYGTGEKRDILEMIEKRITTVKGSDLQKEKILQKILIDFYPFMCLDLSYQQFLNLKTEVKKLFLKTQKEELIDSIFSFKPPEKKIKIYKFEPSILAKKIEEIELSFSQKPPRGVDIADNIIYKKIAIVALSHGAKIPEILGGEIKNKEGVLDTKKIQKYLGDIKKHFASSETESLQHGIRKGIERLKIGGCKTPMDLVKMYRNSFVEVDNA